MTEAQGELSVVRQLLAALPLPAALLGADRRLVWANSLFTELGGVDERGVSGRALGSACANALADLDEQAAAAFGAGRAESRRIAFQHGDGRRVAEVTIVPLASPDGAWLVIGVDVTEREQLAHQLEEQARVRGSQTARLEHLVDESARQLQAMRKARERERRLAAVGQLAAGVMHDVNNVLNPILAAAFLVEASADDADAVREYAQRISRAAEMGVARLARLRQFIRQEPIAEHTEAAIDLAQAVDEVLALAAPLWQERSGDRAIRVERDLALGAVVRGVASELRAAMLNLVHNALDAMPGAGTLTVNMAVRDGFADVEFRDTGSGMAPDVLERAFEPFFSTKGSRGTGLGLSEVYGIVKRHRGVAEIDSVPGEGTVVRMRFPLSGNVG